MITLTEYEIDSLRILFMGAFFGWHIRTAWGIPKKHAKWMIVKNMRWPSLNLRFKK